MLNIIEDNRNEFNIKLSDDFLVGSKDNALIFSGIPTPNLSNLLQISNRKCIYMMQDKEVTQCNAIPTVEGIIADVVVNTESTIKDSRILVFGYGNIGKVLVKYLRLLGADVTVAIIDKNDKKILDSSGISSFYSNDVSSLVNSVGSVDVIVNTVPSTVIDNSLIKYINRDCYVLDIASHPHGIDREVLDELFIKNKLYLGIPGKVAPKTSGKILSRKINSVLGD